MISASEVRKKMSDIVMKTMGDIESAVNRAAQQGLSNTSVAIRSGFDYSPVIKELNSLGYQAKIREVPGDYREPGYRALEVSW